MSATARAANATPTDGLAALPYLHQFVMAFGERRVVVVVTGRFSE